MTSTLRRLQRFAMVAVMALYATVASPQQAGKPQARGHQDHAEAAPSPGGAAGMAGMPCDVMERMAALDERIDMLVTDMNMFVGDLKLETMAALLTAIVERQSLMRSEMMRMHHEVTPSPMAVAEAALPDEELGWEELSWGGFGDVHLSAAEAASPDEEPGGMCSPSP